MTTTTVAVKSAAEVGEGPFWVPGDNIVHWVDIVSGHILTTDYGTGHTERFVYKEMVGAAVPRSNGGMVAAVESGFAGFDSIWGITHTLDILGDNYRMNDAKTDASGIFWAGSNTIDFIPGEGTLWRLDENWNATVVHTGLTLPNGIGWSPDNTVMYVVDSMQKIILKFPFDPTASIITGGPELFAGPEAFDGLPDGLAVDTRGHIWLAEFGSGQLTELSPDGSIASQIALPTKQTTSCAFVGPQLDKLWVTSAAIGLDPAADPDAGSIFEVTGLPAQGIPVAPFAG